jgi:hypothetical protein
MCEILNQVFSNQNFDTVWNVLHSKKTVVGKRKAQHMLKFYVLQINYNNHYIFSEELLPYKLPEFCTDCH